MDQWSVIWHVAIAFALGGLIGIEREVKSKPAGLRTLMLVCGAVTLLAMLSHATLESFSADRDIIMADPIRIIQAIVLGVSFLGAGVIAHAGTEVKNLTTSATILFTAGIGVAVALDQFIIACVLTLAVVAITWIFGIFEDRLPKVRKLQK